MSPPAGGINRIVTASSTTLTPGPSMPKRWTDGNRGRCGSCGKLLLALPCGIRATVQCPGDRPAPDPDFRSMTNGRAAHRIVMGAVVFSPLFDLISAIRPSKMRENSRRLSRPDYYGQIVAGSLLRLRSAASTAQRSITVAEVTERARQSGVGGAPGVRQRKCLFGKE